MPKVKGSAPLLRRVTTTRDSASAVAIGSNGSPSISLMIAACSAGDTVIATLALAHAAGASMPECAMLANHAAGIVVGKVGTATLSRSELLSDFVARNAHSAG